ncbi:DEAD DEAH box helicase Helicase conserved C terminal domain [Trypanosoma vivax]|nr:putative ATP-dependent RNA helicase [Trypanosoma vivax]KAH8607380.1 DEAD DEAH box helicase Helicase conserved C terminal domain [Trypanosoma vivax]
MLDTKLDDARSNHDQRLVKARVEPKAAESLNPFTNLPYTPQYYELLLQRRALPVYGHASRLVEQVRDNPVILLVGETGSGKTTQVPQFIAGMCMPGIVACTQPRRIAAISIASRVAAEMDVKLGDEVGYHVRFKSMLCEKTKVLYMTDGMLLREVLSDGNLSRFAAVVVDEAHERTVDTDILLGVLRLLIRRRPNFRLIVMSATLEMEKFKSYFSHPPLIYVSGRMHEVAVHYARGPVENYVEACVNCVCEIHAREPAGDILCFLTGESEIERAVHKTRMRLLEAPEVNEETRDASQKPKYVRVLPLYGSLSVEDQNRVFATLPGNVRKIIFATNVAETSLTIDGIVYVVDCGYHKQSLYNAEARVDYLLPSLISKASAEQRKGRAGRTRPGKCFRMFTMQEFASFPPQTHPEVMRTSMINTVLLLLQLKVENPYQFAFIDPPSQESIMDAYLQLSHFGAVDDDLRLTDVGRLMAEFPVDARIARMLLRSEEHRCGADAVVIASMLETRSVFIRPAMQGSGADQAHLVFHHPDGDHLSLFNVFHAFCRSGESPGFCFEHFISYQAIAQAVNVYRQLSNLMRRKGIPLQSTYSEASGTYDFTVLRRAVLEGYFMQVAYKPPGAEKYKTVRDSQWVALHRHSRLARGLQPQWILYDRLEMQGKDGTFIRMASKIEPEWLLQVSDFFTDTSEFADGEICLILQDLNAKNGTTQAPLSPNV